MIILIAGTTHTGKTVLAQRLMEQYKIPYYSIDYLKMGLIRSGQTELTPDDDSGLTPYLWQIIKEIIKTAIENKQSLIIEGCYIPFDWRKDFGEKYLKEINYYCLVMSEAYIEKHFRDILSFENAIEHRVFVNQVSKSQLKEENNRNLQQCKEFGLNYKLIDKAYEIDIKL